MKQFQKTTIVRSLLPLVTSALLLIGQIHVCADDAVDVVRWDFETETSSVFDTHGSVLRDQAGPRPAEFPDFEADNTAIKLETRGSYLSIADPGADSPFDFHQGDAITIEAWVNLDKGLVKSASGAPMVVIGKGRTENPKMARDNQNWALRLVPRGDSVQLSFLFATKPGQGDSHWHRWTSKDKFKIDSGWHHVAVAYRFGDPASIKGWIDGKSTSGAWDMGGETKEPPVVDDDEVWIGSAKVNNGLVGRLDAIAVHRGILADSAIASRFHRSDTTPPVKLAKEVMPEFDELPKNRVLLTFSDDVAEADRWLNEDEFWPPETLRLIADEFLLPRIPRRYDSWGIRDDWKGPVLMRMAADVELPATELQFLLRARGLARLWVDGVLVARTNTPQIKSPDGEQAVTPVATPPMPGMRAHGYHQQEVFGKFISTTAKSNPQQRHRVVLEVMVGGPGKRTESGEVCVAVGSHDQQLFQILTPKLQDAIPLTNEQTEPVLDQIEKYFARHDDQARRAAAASQNEYWDHRHQIARNWVATQSRSDRPEGKGHDSALRHPIDQFIDTKIATAVDAASTTDHKVAKHFHEQVLPILREQCFRCHGEKEKGGLKLNSRDAALMAGESELAAVVPGDPDASELIAQVRSGAMPPTESGLSEKQIETLEKWIADGAVWPSPMLNQQELALAPLIDDATFMRRVHLDTIGVPPTPTALKQFFSDDDPNKRTQWIDRLLDDERLADHWISYWQDILAENPPLINQSMGSTGPFRWFLHDSLRDNKPLDRMVTELVMMRGNVGTGGSAAFALAGESDAPFAAKSHILAAAFLGIELQCAKCHDSPYHTTTQKDLYSLAAMIERKPVKVPKTSRVPDAFFESKGREALIQVTLPPDALVSPEWPFAEVTGINDDELLDALITDPQDTRERFAGLLTSPQNQRFSQVIVNRIWKRLMGAGLVEPVDDWEGRQASDPELLAWLAEELVLSGYDMRHVLRLILTSQAYMREAIGDNLNQTAEQRFFNAPDRRRLTAEQVVDSMHVATGNEMDCEELTFVHDGQRPLDKRLTLGTPSRAWMLAGLNNERDRPSLSLPKAQTIVDVLEAFGWNGTRQNPISDRETEPNVLQPGILSNGTLAMTLTRAAYKSDLANLAIDAPSPQSLVDELLLRVLCRFPTDDEEQVFSAALADGFDTRIVPKEKITWPVEPPPLPIVTWFNHLQPETTTIQQENQRRVSQGPPVDPRLDAQWRAAYEDFVWSLINHRDFVWMP